LNKLAWEDWEFWLHAAKKGWEFFHIPEVLFRYRKKKNSMALKALCPEFRDKLNDYILFKKHSESLYSEFSKLYYENVKYDYSKINRLIYEKDSTIDSLNRKIKEIQSCITWKVISRINSFTEFLFPIGTRRRNIFDLWMMGLLTIVNEGWKSFWIKYKNYERNKINKNHEYYFQRIENEKKCNISDIKNEIENFKYKPLISIIMPTWNTPDYVLGIAIDSVQNQLYTNWELCIADGNSVADTKKILKKYEKQDGKIKLILLNENEGISENSNKALSLATGEFIGLLDHDDELTDDALYEVVKLLQKHPEADLIYSDEDKIDVKGKRSDPFFKPDWSPDLLLSQNYISHFGIYRKKIINEIGGFRKGYEGSQDYDLVIRFSEQTDRIFHIPKILYHWRMIPGSLAANPKAKEYAYANAKKTLADAMKRRRIPIESIKDIRYLGHYRIKYKIIENNKVSIIIPTKDNLKLLKKCINSILQKTEYENYEILIINNQSRKDETLKYFQEIKENKKIKIINYNKSFNFSAINNYAVKFVQGIYLLFLNDDTEVISNEWINAMLEHCQKKHVGAVGAKLLFPDNTIQHAGVFISSNGFISHSHKPLPDSYPGYFARPHLIQNLSAVTGACLMVKNEHFNEVGGFDDENLTIMFNDIDLCLKLRKKGYLIIYTPFAELYHHESVSRGYEITPKIKKEVEFMKRKWKKIIENDPYYNPNLTLDKEDFSFRL